MRSSTLSLVLSAASLPLAQAAALSLPSTSPATTEGLMVDGLRQTDHLAIIDTTDGIPSGPPMINGTTTDLVARNPLTYCIDNEARAGVCVAVAGVAAQIGQGIAGLVKGKSDKHDCSAVDGSTSGVAYRVYATGNNSDTTAQLGTIASAIANYLRDVDDSVCDTHCIQLDHGGTWTGYVVLTPAGADVDSFYYGSKAKFGNRGSGGKNDNHN